MSGILILRYIQLCEIPFVSYCFQLHKIVSIFGTVSQSSLNAFTNKLQNQNLIVPDIRLISLDRITYCSLHTPPFLGYTILVVQWI